MSLVKDYSLLLLLTGCFVLPLASSASSFKRPLLDFAKSLTTAALWTVGGGAALILGTGGVLAWEQIARKWGKRIQDGKGCDVAPPPPPPPPPSTKPEAGTVGKTEVSDRAIQERLKAKEKAEGKIRQRRAGKELKEEGIELDEL